MRWYERPQDGAHETDVKGEEEGGVRWIRDVGDGFSVKIYSSA